MKSKKAREELRSGLRRPTAALGLIIVLLLALTGVGLAAPVAPNGPHTVRQVAQVDAALPDLAPESPSGLSTLGDYVWHDPNASGTHTEAGEAEYLAGINGVLINLYEDKNFDGVIDPGEYVESKTTGDNPNTTTVTETGWYDFSVTAAGTQYIVELDPSNFVLGGPLYGYVLTSKNNFGASPKVVYLGPDPIIDYNNADFGFATASIQVVKTAGNAVDGATEYLQGTPPQSVTYRYVVTNTGETRLNNIVVRDDNGTPADPADDFTACTIAGPLAAGASATACTVTRSLSGDRTNIATVTGQPIDSVNQPTGSPVTDTDNAVVDIVNPAINVVKTAGNAADGAVEYLQGPPTKSVTYTYVVTNPGDTPLYVDKTGANATYKVTDNLCSPLVYVSGDTDSNTLLDTTETWTFTCAGTIATNNPVTNIATAVGNPTDASGNDLPDINDATDTDTAVVDLVNPAINVVKTAGNAADGAVEYLQGPPSKSVTYTYVVTNPGDTPLYVDKTGAHATYKVTDNLCSPLVYGGGDTDSDTLLDTTETWTFTCAGTISTNSPVTNIATAVGNPTDASGNDLPDINDATDTDTAVVDLVNPAINVVKTAGNAADGAVEYLQGPPSKSVTYTYVVTNPGDTPLYVDKTGANATYKVTDNLCSPLVYGGGDTGNDNLLTTGETWTFTCAGTISTNTPVTNIATAVGNPTDASGNDLPDINDATDTDDAVVDLVNPAINVVKTAGNAADGAVEYLQGPPSKSVTYTYVVTNPGDTPLYVDKTGANATYKVTDNLCSPLVYGGGDADSDTLLDTTETWTFTCAGTIATNNPVTNIATAVGNPTDASGNDLPDINDATDTDDAVVDLVNPAINVVKTAGNAADGAVEYLQGPPSKSVTYTYVVTNPGDTPLYVDKTGAHATYKVTDNLCSPLVYGGGDADSDTLLDTTETWTFTCAGTISTNSPVTNIATAVGNPTDASGNDLPDINDATDTDTAVVDLVNPAINVVKTAGNAADGAVEYLQGPPSKSVTYTYVVTNPGDTPLYVDKTGAHATYKVTDNLCSPLVYGGGDTGNDNLLTTGETWTFTCAGTISTNNPVTNIATAIGNPTDASGNDLPDINDATDTDDAIVDIVNPAINVVKTAGNAADGAVEYLQGPPTKSVTYTYVVTNPGDTPLYVDKTGANATYKVTDNLCSPLVYVSGDADSDTLLDTTETWTFTCAGTISTNSPVTNIATAVGNPTDASGNDLPDINNATDTDDAIVDIVNPAINVVKTAGAAADGATLYVQSGANVTYTYVWTNTGDTSLRNITLVDDNGTPGNTGDDFEVCALSGPVSNGFTFTCTASRAITANKTNIVTATGTPVDGLGVPLPDIAPVTDTDDAIVLVYSTLGDFVWWDVNGNGQQDSEPGIPGVTVELYNSGGAKIGTTTTDATGKYSFNTLMADTYTVKIPNAEFASGETLYNWTATAKDVGADATDSDGNLTTHDAVVALSAGVNETTIDFGFLNPVTTYSIVKTLEAATPSPVRVGGEVRFKIRIVNNGPGYLGVLPLQDDYDKNYLTYGASGSYATPASIDNNDDGHINWSDLTLNVGHDLAPSEATEVIVRFTAKADTLGADTINTAIVSGALVDPDGPAGPLPAVGPLPTQQDTEPVKLYQPTGITVASFSVTAGDGGMLVAWDTASELNIAGFGIVRGEATVAEFIAAEKAGADEGASYSFLDANAGAGGYALMIYKLDGSVEQMDLGG